MSKLMHQRRQIRMRESEGFNEHGPARVAELTGMCDKRESNT